MKVLVLFSHPVEESFGAAIHREAVTALREAGHEVDDCDLYAEGFDPVLSRHDRLVYHDVPANKALVEGYVDRLKAAEGLVIVTPIWNFGFPAMLKGYFDRVWLPGVSFDIADGRLTPTLNHIRKLAAVVTYGATPWRAFLAGNPPRKIVTRVLRASIRPMAPVSYLAHYDMNNCTPETRERFLGRVRTTLARF